MCVFANYDFSKWLYAYFLQGNESGYDNGGSPQRERDEQPEREEQERTEREEREVYFYCYIVCFIVRFELILPKLKTRNISDLPNPQP